MRMAVLALLVCGVACGPSPTPSTQNVRLDLPDAGPTTVPPARTEKLGMPRGAVLEASFDAAEALALVPELRAELERAMNLAPGALEVGALGLDARRPISIAIAPLDESQRKLVERLRPLASTKTPQAMDGAIREVLAAGPLAPLRILLPITDATKAKAAIGAALQKDRWKPHGEDAFEKGRTFMKLAHDDANLAVDVATGQTANRAATALRAPFAGASESPMSLDGEILRMRWSPSAYASYGFLQGVEVTSEAVSGGSIDPSMRDQIAAQGFWEAGRAFVLAGNDKGAFFDRIEVSARVSPFEITLRAQPGPAFTMPPAEALRPSTSIALDGAWASVEGTQAFAGTWSALGDASKLIETVREAGSAGWFVALPQLLGSAALAAPSMFHLVAPAPAVVARFERTEVVWTTGHEEVFVGLLPAATTRAAAECALAASTPCDAKSRLKLNVAAPAGDRFAKLIEVDHRFAVLLAHSAPDLKVTPRAQQSGPVRFEIALAQAVQSLPIHFAGSIPSRVVGEMSAQGGALQLRIAPP